jgi:hypothetical protein
MKSSHSKGDTTVAQTVHLEIGDILELNDVLRLRYVGDGKVVQENRPNASWPLGWTELRTVDLTPAQIAGWHARKAKI